MILRVTEGSLAPVACVEEQECERIDDCVMAQVWQKINTAVCEVVDSITLADLKNRNI